MLIGLFLLYFAAFIAAFMSIQWLFDFASNATMTDSVTFVATLGGGAAIAVLAKNGLGGLTIAVAIMVFWSLFLFGTDHATVVTTLDIAAAMLVAAAAAVVSESFLRRASGNRP